MQNGYYEDSILWNFLTQKQRKKDIILEKGLKERKTCDIELSMCYYYQKYVT